MRIIQGRALGKRGLTRLFVTIILLTPSCVCFPHGIWQAVNSSWKIKPYPNCPLKELKTTGLQGFLSHCNSQIWSSKSTGHRVAPQVVRWIWENSRSNQIPICWPSLSDHWRWRFQLQESHASWDNEMFCFITFLAKRRDCIRRGKRQRGFSLISVMLISSNFCREGKNVIQCNKTIFIIPWSELSLQVSHVAPNGCLVLQLHLSWVSPTFL